MTRTAIARVPLHIDKKVREIVRQYNISYARALEEYINRKRGLIEWDL